MPWNYDANHPFAGIAEKLQRSEQNILDLHSEIDLFITNGLTCPVFISHS